MPEQRIGVQAWSPVKTMCWLAIAAMALSGMALGETALNEGQVKAAFILNFVGFVEWPPETFASAAVPVQICVLGRSAVAPDLHALARNKKSIRRLIIREVATADDARNCHVLFIGVEEQRSIRNTSGALQGLSVLTITESADFLVSGCVINLVVVEERVRFEVNLDAAERAHLHVSTRLLTVARAVHSGID